MSEYSYQELVDFYEDWMKKLESLSQQLVQLLSSHPSDTEDKNYNTRCDTLVSKVLLHYKQFYQVKNKAVDDPLLILSPPWLSSSEKKQFWFGLFQPTVVFTEVYKAIVESLSSDEKHKIGVILADTDKKEGEVKKEMDEVQNTMALPVVFDLIIKMKQNKVDGDVSYLQECVKKYQEGVNLVLDMAHTLRISSLMRLLGILTPGKQIKFLTVSIQYILDMRRCELDTGEEGRDRTPEASTSYG